MTNSHPYHTIRGVVIGPPQRPNHVWEPNKPLGTWITSSIKPVDEFSAVEHADRRANCVCPKTARDSSRMVRRAVTPSGPLFGRRQLLDGSSGSDPPWQAKWTMLLSVRSCSTSSFGSRDARPGDIFLDDGHFWQCVQITEAWCIRRHDSQELLLWPRERLEALFSGVLQRFNYGSVRRYHMGSDIPP